MARFTFFVALLFALGMTACSKDGGDAKKADTAKAPAAAKKVEKTAAKPAAKPAPKPAPKAAPAATGIQGKWTIDVEGFSALPEFQALKPKEKEMATQMFTAMKMSFEITADRIKFTGEFMGKKQTKDNAYKVAKQEGGKYSLEITRENGKTETQEMELKGNQLIVREGKQAIVLKRI